MPNGGNIHVGAGNVIINPDSSPVDLGYCSDGATLKLGSPLEAIMVDQELGAVGYFPANEECTFETILSETTATALKYALGYGTVTQQAAGAGQVGYDKLTFGGNTELTSYVLEYRAPKRDNRDLYIRIRLYEVNISPELEVAFTKNGKTGFKFTAKAIVQTGNSAGDKLGYMMVETAEESGGRPTLAVSSVVPADGASSIAVDTTIVVTFNRAVHPSSVNIGNFTLTDAAGNGIDGSVSHSDLDEVTFTPDANLSVSTVYIFTISKNVRALDEFSDTMADNDYYNFTTTA